MCTVSTNNKSLHRAMDEQMDRSHISTRNKRTKDDYVDQELKFLNPNSLDNKGSWRILKDFFFVQ